MIALVALLSIVLAACGALLYHAKLDDDRKRAKDASRIKYGHEKFKPTAPGKAFGATVARQAAKYVPQLGDGQLAQQAFRDYYSDQQAMLNRYPTGRYDLGALQASPEQIARLNARAQNVANMWEQGRGITTSCAIGLNQFLSGAHGYLTGRTTDDKD